MGAARWLEQDSNDNIDISGATLVGSYTCDADRMVFARLYAQGLAGGGDYIYYATLTPVGLSEGEGKKTTQTLGATTYTLFAQTKPLFMRNGDVLKVYIDGLAGDGGGSPTPDTRVDFFEDASLQPATAGRTLSVDTGGEVILSAAGIDSIIDEIIEGTLTLRQALRIIFAVLFGVSTGGGTAAVTFRDIANLKPRVSATVDASGNRSGITLDGDP